MHNPEYAAYLFTVLIGFVVAFQIALALGAPWGEMAMGGKFPGRFSPLLRFTALIQVVILVLIDLVVLIRSGLVLGDWFALSESVIWGVVLFSLIGLILNTLTPSKKERMLWAPVSLVLLGCATYVALG